MNEKKLLIFIPSVEGGGVEKNFFLITNSLSKVFKEIIVITANKNQLKNKISNKIKLVGPNSKIGNNKMRYLKYFFSIFYLIKFLVFNKNTLIFSFQANSYASLIAKIFRIKIITRSNSSSEGWSKNGLKIFLYKALLKIPNEIIVNSNEFKKELDKKFNIKTTVIYNPLNKNEIIKKSKIKLNLKFFKKKDLKIISVGRLVDQKDQITLLKALNLIKEKIKFKLILVGRGGDIEKLKRFVIYNNLSNSVRFIPFQKNPYNYIVKADLFILTSKFEGLPNVLLESQCLKKYIISTNCPTGPKEILLNGNLGDLIPIQNYEKLASKILEFNKNKNKKFIKKKITNSFIKLSRFDFDKNMKKYQKIIKEYIYY